MATGVALKSLAAGTEWDLSGDALSGRQVYVYSRGTTTQVTVYQDSGLTTPYTQPLTTGADGTVGAVPGYVASGQSIDFVDVQTNARTQAEALLVSDVLALSKLAVYATDGQYGAIGDGVADDTAAIQAAVNAASAKAAGSGCVDMVLSPGHTFLTGTIAPASNVRVVAYGATIKLKPSSSFGVFDTGSSTSAPTNFHLRGGTFVGTGAETAQQIVFRVEGGNASSGSAQDASCCDITVTNWATGVIYFANCIRARANFNTILNCCNFTGSNAINLNIGSTKGTGSLAYHECEAIGNFIDGCSAEGIAVGETGNGYVGDVNAIITGNTVICNGTTGGGPGVCINIEWSTATSGKNSRFIVANNHCTYNGSYTAASGIGVSVSPASNNDPLKVAKVIIANNTVSSNQRGIYSAASDAVITGNHVELTSTTGNGLFVQGNGTFTGTGDITTSSPTVNNVSAGLNSVVNGTPIVGTGIPAGTYLLSGAGTTTWTLSANATATTTGLSITARSQLKRVNVTGNIVHSAASPAAPIVQLYALRDSDFRNNLVFCDAGSATTQAGIYLQYCGWVDVAGNRVDHAPGHGIQASIINDITIAANHIVDPSEGGASNDGVNIANQAGNTTSLVRDNTIRDDRGTHVMRYGIRSDVAGLSTINNIISGALTAATSNTTTVSGV